MIGFEQIIGGAPSSVAAMTKHLMTQTLQQDQALAAAYYHRGMSRGPIEALAKDIADEKISFEAGLELALTSKRDGDDAAHAVEWLRGEVAPDFDALARYVARENTAAFGWEFVLDRLTAQFDRAQQAALGLDNLAPESRALHGLSDPEPVAAHLLGLSADEVRIRREVDSERWFQAVATADLEVDVAREAMGKRLEAMVERAENGLDNAPVAVIRPDLNPRVALGLGISGPDAILSMDEVNALLAGRRADGELIEGKRYAGEREIAPDPKTGVRRWSQPIGSYDFCPTPDKSISVAWAFANETERAEIFNCHIEAAREAVGYIASEVGVARIGDGGQDGWEEGHVAWMEFTHFTSRKTVIGVENGNAVVDQDTKARGDPNLHTHFLIPNAVFCESGRVGSLDTMAIRGFIFEADLYYHARFATKLRERGYEAHLDERTGAAKMTIIPELACDQYSKRTKAGEALARKYTADRGETWEDLTEDQRQERMKRAVQDRDQRANADKDDVADFDGWKRQAEEIGWNVPKSFQLIGPTLPELSIEERHQKAYEIGLPWLATRLEQRSVVPHWDLRLSALRGLVETGCDGLEDIKGVTTIMRENGVVQNGERTSIIWGQEPDKRYTSVTTALHEREESEFVRLALGASRDKSKAIPVGLLRAKIAESGLKFEGEHGEAQHKAIVDIATGGRFGVVVGAAGSGKSAMLRPLVAAWREMGRDIHGASLAWRQADDLQDPGIDKRNVHAISVLLKRIENGDIKLTENSVVCVDEWGLLGTHQGLKLLREQERTGCTIVALGDDKQVGSVEAGAIFDLSRRALGILPEIPYTTRQQSDQEKIVVGLFRDGQAAQALAIKRANGTAEMVYGGRDGVIKRVAALYGERLEASGKAPSISAPTNSDAHQIGEAVRDARRRAGLVGPDKLSVRATDGERDYTLRLAVGDQIRLFSSTKADMGVGHRRNGQPYRIQHSIGRNGSVLEVVGIERGTLTLRDAKGRSGTVKLSEIATAHGRTRLAYGYASTIHTSQGSTSDEHIFALPSGSGTISGAAGYSASTRHRQKAFLLTSEAAERIAVKDSRPLNDPHEIMLDDKWANVAQNMVLRRKADSALSMLERADQIRRGAIRDFHAALRPADPRRPEASHAADLVQRIKLAPVVAQLHRHVVRPLREEYERRVGHQR